MGQDDIRNSGIFNRDVEVDSSEDRQLCKRKHVWTTMHSFFVVMGGFVFDTSDLSKEEKFLPGSRDRVTLTPKALLYVAEKEPSLVPDISEASITDKSKADALAKGIVCLQACWFMVQCFVRIAQGLPISLLELNTIAHAVCALLIYGLWWDKPLDIEEPTMINDKEMHCIIALLCFRSVFDDRRDYQRVIFEWENLEASASGLHSSSNQSGCRGRVQGPESAPPGLHLGNGTGETERLYDGVRVIGAPVRAFMGLSSKSLHYHSSDRRRWALAVSAWKKYEDMPDFNLLRDRMRNWPVDFHGGAIFDFIYEPISEVDKDGLVVFFAFTLAGLLYGGIHLLAWKAPFTSNVHRSLWRISAITVTSSGPTLLILLGTTRLVYKLYKTLSPLDWFDSIYTEGSYVFRKLFRRHYWAFATVKYVVSIFYFILFVSCFSWVLVCLAGMVFYLLARTYIVVECFISLAYLPEPVFQQGRWTLYFPHIA